MFQPRVDDDAKRKQNIDGINHSLLPLTKSIIDDIKAEKQGLYPHPEKSLTSNSTAISLGYIQYTIKNKIGERLEISEFSLVSCNSIKMTENYQRLKSLVNAAGYNIQLKEINVNGDGVEVYEKLDEHSDNLERYFVIHVSGW
ncbi:hypothetical protein MNBD_GAMMA06-379 [hydrothermal vent metagenome]|uniref:Uncharacterized protein n=1 Tax=hydrothermal vent metagenome TaxID=652676 RepID=A0A3B0X940_9ZZZZ